MNNGRVDLEACWQGAHEYPGFPLPQEALKAFVRLARASIAIAKIEPWELMTDKATNALEELKTAHALFTDSAEPK